MLAHPKHIILIAGRAGSGKDTMCKLINEETNNEYKRIALADPLKYIAGQFGWSGKKDKKSRELLILIGQICRKEIVVKGTFANSYLYNKITKDKIYKTDIYYKLKHYCEIRGKKFEDIFWSRILMEEINQICSTVESTRKFIIPDFRFPNEYSQINVATSRLTKITTVLIKRDNCEYINDPSEYSLEKFEKENKFNIIINNNGTINNQLRNKIKVFIKEVM